MAVAPVVAGDARTSILEVVVVHLRLHAESLLTGIPHRSTGWAVETVSDSEGMTFHVSTGISLNAQGFWDSVPSLSLRISTRDMYSDDLNSILSARLRGVLDDAILPMIGAW